MFGLFVQKHAEAVSLNANVACLYTLMDSKISKTEVRTTSEKGFQEIRVYYPVGKNLISKQYNYLKAYKRGFNVLYESWGKPDIIHANILTRTGAIALIHKILHKTPYVITEHWSRYLAVRNSYSGFLRKLVTKIVLKNSSAVYPVSENLQQAMISHKLLNNNYLVVNNVVDDCFFIEKKPDERQKKRILHISCFDEQAKNMKGIIRSAYELSKIRDDFEIVFLGTGLGFNEVFSYFEGFDFKENTIRFLGEVTAPEVADWIRNSDFTLLFSNYENAPVVISESLACGKPVLSTNVGGIPEHINESNGILIDAGDEQALTEKLNFMLDHFKEYNAVEISKKAYHSFSYQSVGKIFLKEYKRILNKA